MRLLTFLICVFLISISSTQNIFEGELIYHHNMKINEMDYSESRNYFDTLSITYKNKNYIKLTNKKNYEKLLFIDSLKKRYTIYKNNLSRTKRLSMDEDNLNFGKLYNRENSHFGDIISLSKSDTLLNYNNQDRQFKKLIVERKYGNEIYIYSESDEYVLTDHRNLLRFIGEQIHPKEIASELNNAIMYYYKLEIRNTDMYEEYRLVKIKNEPIDDSVFKIPAHKDAKGFKRENKKRNRFKFYVLTE